MNVLSDYITGRYCNRLKELLDSVQAEGNKMAAEGKQDIKGLTASLNKLMNQFITTTRMHLKNFETQGLKLAIDDEKYIKFVRPAWIIDLMLAKASIDEIRRI